MSYRTLLISAVLAAGASLAGGLAQADIVAGVNGIAVKASDGLAPARGMTMNQVASKFGAPVTKVPAVGKPPISRWDYPGFVVYFERDYVIHSVISDSAAPTPVTEAAPEAPAPAPAPAVSAVSEPAAAIPAAAPPPPAPAPADVPSSAPTQDAAPADQAPPAP
jgi:hypothetical protein